MEATDQIDWVEQDSGLPVVSIGHVIVTNYETSPYKITGVDGPCTCPEYLREINGDDSPSEPHYHMTCTKHGGKYGDEYYLAGYRLDGSNVWSDDRIVKA